MKKSFTLAAVGLTALGLASPAFAFVFAPAGANFSGSGPFTVIDASGTTLSCSARYKLKTSVNGNQLKFVSVLFFGASGCSAITAQGLQWSAFKTPSNTTVKIVGMQLTTPNCGPNNVPNGTLSGSVLSYSSAPLGSCTVSFSITISPTIS